MCLVVQPLHIPVAASWTYNRVRFHERPDVAAKPYIQALIACLNTFVYCSSFHTQCEI